MYYQIKVKHKILVETAKGATHKWATDTYCFEDDALESCVMKALSYFQDNLKEPVIKSISDTVVIEFVGSKDADRIYQCRVHFILVDDKGNEKKSAEYYLVAANNLKSVEETMEKKLKTAVHSYEIHSINLSKVKEVIE